MSELFGTGEIFVNRTVELLILDFSDSILFLVLLFGKMVVESNGFFVFSFVVK